MASESHNWLFSENYLSLFETKENYCVDTCKNID